MELINLESENIAGKINILRHEVRNLIYDKKNSEAMHLIADFIIDNNKIKTIRNDKDEEMYIYKEGIYLENAKTYIKELSEEILGTQYTKQKGNNIADIIVVRTYIEMDEFFNQQLKNPYLLPVKNGILDLKDGGLIPFNSDYYFFSKLNFDYNETAKCNKIIKFIEQITKSKDDVKVIQEMFGFCLVKEYTYEKSLMLYGSNGRNGKSKLLSILKYFVGSDNVSGIDLQDFSNDNFAVSNLRNKLVNIASDISNEAINNAGAFKKLTGRDVVDANRKNLSRIKFVNYAKMIFASNELPPVHTNSDAFWLRWVIIEFPYQFLPQKEIDALKKDGSDLDNVFLQDPTILDDLTCDDEMSGLINWSIQGLHRLIKNKDFSDKDTSKSIHSSWLRKSNSVASFILDCIEEDYDSMIPKADFKKKYLSYCRSNRIKSLSEKVIKRTLESETGATTSRRTVFVEGVGDQFVYVWEGVRFKDINLNIGSIVKEGEVTTLLNNREEFVE